MEIGSIPSLTVTDGMSPRFDRNCSYQIQAVPQQQIRIRRTHQISRCGGIAVDFRPRFGDRHDIGGIACDIAGHIGNDGEGSHDLQSALLRRGGCGEEKDGEDDAKHEYLRLRTIRKSGSYARNVKGRPERQPMQFTVLFDGLSNAGALYPLTV